MGTRVACVVGERIGAGRKGRAPARGQGRGRAKVPRTAEGRPTAGGREQGQKLDKGVDARRQRVVQVGTGQSRSEAGSLRLTSKRRLRRVRLVLPASHVERSPKQGRALNEIVKKSIGDRLVRMRHRIGPSDAGN